jgi:mRNA-degrading endonuclease toxin of MazEF toxin-antitoxin module
MKHIKVDGESHLVRNENGVILSNDISAVEQARLRKKLRKEKDAELETLKQDVNDIKLLLNQIVGKLDGTNSR